MVPATLVRVGPLEVWPGEAAVSGRTLQLSPRELGLLTALAEHAGHIVTREELYERSWERALPRGDRSVDVYVRKLRVKLEAAAPGWTWIHTHAGFGYRLSPEHSQPVRMADTTS